MKSNLNTFGGNQFKLPDQADQLRYYFSMQYFALKCGSTMSRVLYPIVREDVKCFGMNDCYPLAFSLSTFAMFISFLALMMGRKTYAKEARNGNMFVKVIGCVSVSELQDFPLGVSINFLLDLSCRTPSSKN
jgi:solute carrier family 15 (oligopeptide transporter), member 1